MELWMPHFNFGHIWPCGELGLWILDLKFSEMLNTATVCLFGWQKFLSGSFEWSCGSKIVVLTIFGHVVTITLDLWATKFWKCLTLPMSVYLIDKSFYFLYSNEVMAPKLTFCPYLVMWRPWSLTFGPQMLRNAWYCPSKSFSMDKSCYLIHLSVFMAP